MSDKNSVSKQVPLTQKVIASIMTAADPLHAYAKHSTRFTESWALLKIDPYQFAACVDDRPPFMSLEQQIGGPVSLGEVQLTPTRMSEDALLQRPKLPISPWPGGYLGVTTAFLTAAIGSGRLQQEDWWQNSKTPNEFSDALLAYVTPLVAEVAPAVIDKVHIDNHHGQPLICTDEVYGWRYEMTSIQQCLEDGVGCGAAGKMYQVVHGVLRLLGHEIQANQFADVLRMGQDGDGLSPELAQRANRTLIHDAAKRGKRVVVYAGGHASAGIVISGVEDPVKTADRTIMRLNNHGAAEFKTDLYSADRTVPHWRVLDTLNQQFDGALGDPLAYLLGVNLYTYLQLGQELTPRYFI